MRLIYQLDCGGMPVRYAMNLKETVSYFDNYLEEDGNVKSYDIRVTDEFLAATSWLVNEREKSRSFREYRSLMVATGNYLLSHNRTLFHGAAFLLGGKAWILTAPSGTGKTTQLVNLKRIAGDQLQIINGDVPVIASHEDGSVWVYPSPWRGKEFFGSKTLSGQLGGIILLEQGDTNEIVPMEMNETVYSLYIEFVSYPDHEWQIQEQAKLLEKMLEAVPVLKFRNKGDMNSSLMLMRKLTHIKEEAEYSREAVPKDENEVVKGPCETEEGFAQVSDSRNWNIRPGVALVSIKGVSMLVADRFAQQHCHHVMVVSETGAFIWNMLNDGRTIEDMINAMCQRYEIPDSCDIKEDIKAFIQSLREDHYLMEGSDEERDTDD